MNASSRVIKQVQRVGVVVLIGGIALLSGCSANKPKTIPLIGAYVDHTSGKFFALVFDSTGVTAWENYPSMYGKPARAQMCLSKGSTYTVNGLTLQIQGGTPAAAPDPTVPFRLTAGQSTLKMLGAGYALQLPLTSGKNLTFMKS